MEYLIFILVLIGAFILGAFGFSQIIGTIKFREYAKTPVFTLLFWLILLGFGAFAVLYWLNDSKIALFIGYGISFVLSLRTKPD